MMRWIPTIFFAVFACASSAAETPKDILALRVTGLGYPCTVPLAASHDLHPFGRDELGWVLLCENATYRVGVIADIRAPIRIHEALVYDRFLRRNSQEDSK